MPPSTTRKPLVLLTVCVAVLAINIDTTIVNVALGASQLTSLTSYSYNKYNDTVDFSASALTAALPSIYPVGINPMATVLNQFYSTRKFTQELRLAMPVGEVAVRRIGRDPHVAGDRAQHHALGSGGARELDGSIDEGLAEVPVVVALAWCHVAETNNFHPRC